MNQKYERAYHELEEEHFWFRSRRELISRIVSEYPKNSKILDVGCSTGILLDLLRKEGFVAENLYGIDISDRAIRTAEERGLKNTFQRDAQRFELAQTFDLVIASDCLEHLKDEAEALSTWFKHLNKDGLLIVFVPAFKSLWSWHDVVNGHCRRYHRKELVGLLESAHFEVVKSGYWNVFLFIPIWVFRQFQKLFKRQPNNEEGDLRSLPFGNNMFYKILKQEEKFFGSISFPFGVSTYSIAKKNSI